ncbi:MAG TPA: hypothetical protein VFB35_00985 [Gaiellaceae bacterium]|nr:hypothetical protein [Gaiellaceae bacterium]
MRLAEDTSLRDVDGFRVATPGGRIGWVEERWLDDAGETTAVAVRLPDGQRGLVLRDDVAEVRPDESLIEVRPDARLLELEPPHLKPGPDGVLSASWTTSGHALALPSLSPPAPVASAPVNSEPSFFGSLIVLYAGLLVIACFLTGLCFLVPYLVTGNPY